MVRFVYGERAAKRGRILKRRENVPQEPSLALPYCSMVRHDVHGTVRAVPVSASDSSSAERVSLHICTDLTESMVLVLVPAEWLLQFQFCFRFRTVQAPVPGSVPGPS